MKRVDFMRATSAFAVAPSVPVPAAITQGTPRHSVRAQSLGLQPDLSAANFLSIENGRAIDADYDSIFQTLAAYRNAATNPPPCLVLFFHGGLVSVESGMKTAQMLYPDIVDAGAIPMFFLWHSGVLDAWRPLSGDAETECAEQLPRHPDHSLLQRHFDRKRNVAARLANKTDHGVAETNFEELIRQYNLLATATTWGNMKQSICNGFDPGDPGEPAAMRYITELAKALSADPRPLRIMLVAHSAGTIYISRFLEHFQIAARANPGTQAATKTFDLVFWAPAVSFKRFRSTLIDYGTSINSLRVFGLGDDLESTDTLLVPTGIPLISHIYRRSLLYIVSGAFEPVSEMPLVGMQRYYADVPPYANQAEHIAAVRQWMGWHKVPLIWSKTSNTAPPGFRSTAEHHGDFPGDPETIKSLAYQISTQT